LTLISLPEQRHPHKEILDVLGNVTSEDSADAVLCSIDSMQMCLDGFDSEQIRDALREMEQEGLVVERYFEKFALSKYKELVEADDHEYEALKSRVHEAAKRHGLWPKWNDGWMLVDPSGEAVAYGNMRVLDEYLRELDANEKSAA
jgi:hypothetical protein